ncbi:hypothetical protein STCU_05146 [Strigomonas culicis]|uniref:Succinate dehydrogenase assembly factor 3 n=1 Tax=Strigomonas culicis TaxID=28005 RepID=S9UHJ4_9TRYP|nr:hypothetical protein STCU_05146 [Strigomonas culicis]|eukprot:EPY28408.1 hypothetical protein STCU_05146 [Strigomonas culicis]
MVRLYRTILRLHNKEVAVSLQQARAQQQQQQQQRAVDAKEAAFLQQQQQQQQGGCPATSSLQDPTDMDDILLTYLLTAEQREFGNRFVKEGFIYHLEADRQTALTFYEGWYGYVLQIASGVTARDMTEAEEQHLSDEQREKMKELRGAFYAMRAQNDPGFMQ